MHLVSVKNMLQRVWDGHFNIFPKEVSHFETK